MFLLCLGLGTAVTRVTRWVAQAGTPAPLALAVRSGARSMRVANLTGEAWQGCVVTVEGGWQSPPFAIQPKAVERLPYDEFLAGTLPLHDRPAFTQAFHQTSIRCRDDAGRWQDAAVR